MKKPVTKYEELRCPTCGVALVVPVGTTVAEVDHVRNDWHEKREVAK